MTIRILTTGGTIDGYVDANDVPHGTVLPALLEQARIVMPVEIESVFAKDSRAISDADRAELLAKCCNCSEDRILITHGTYTMADTANYIGKAGLTKTVVIVGAMVPAAEKNSDALFNLGFALAAVQIKGYGVYIAMNGRMFDYDDVRKNPETGYFEKVL